MSEATQPSAGMTHISDTALWVAVYRARESERPDAAFRDPYARALAGGRGEQIASATPFSEQNEWSFLGRTWLFDKYIQQEVEAGADLVLNLACGLDTRPYRMALPASLHWVEVDFPGLLEYKEQILNAAGAKPACGFQRIALDLGERDARKALFSELGSRSGRAIVLTEGLLIYLTREENAALADDLAAQSSFRRWIIDSCSPGLLKMMKQAMGDRVASMPFRFAPEEGLAFYEGHGWKRLAVESMPEGAAEINRLPDFMKPFVNVPVPDPPGDNIWGGVALLGRDY
ncbi:MAG: class I SAM-dependent methyltransferase [Acidobacteria bacterium]|nr:class I SAM-dependent methyltransferase [Acidobacteriota bacterium]